MTTAMGELLSKSPNIFLSLWTIKLFKKDIFDSWLDVGHDRAKLFIQKTHLF